MKNGLNIGCGKDYRKSTDEINWWNVDGDKSVRADAHVNATHEFDMVSAADVDDAYDEIVAIDILEHIRPDKWRVTLEYWCAFLKPGGTIRIQVPNLVNISARYLAGDIDEETANRVIYGERTNEWDTHYQLFSMERLTGTLREFGLEILEQSSLHVNIVVTAKKP